MDSELALTSEQIKKYSRAFHRYDTDRDGSINGKDLGKILRYIGHNPTEAEIQVRGMILVIVYVPKWDVLAKGTRASSFNSIFKLK